uniref:Putative 8 kDa amblyomma family n=1 Tax=Rhipicephalus pulchellus TaxID=72859 RepID=L7MCG9_RHIPC
MDFKTPMNMALALFVLIVIATEDICARPGPPGSAGVMLVCGDPCYIRNDGVAKGCPEECRCVSNKFARGIYTGEGICWIERWRNSTP